MDKKDSATWTTGYIFFSNVNFNQIVVLALHTVQPFYKPQSSH